MNPSLFAEHDRPRNFANKAVRSVCYSPHTSLYFDTFGNVRVCCHNQKYLVGNVATQSIGEIWNGPLIREIRRALERYNFDRGCSYCEWRLASGDLTHPPTKRMDRFEVTAADPSWPKHMEFAISNTCNLECVMCNGGCSSAIRARREKRPPLPNPYREAFFSELRDYLPHLAGAKFLGGEPFLQESCFRIWETLIALSHRIPCHITTNGTLFNARVERVLDQLPVGIAISLDAFRPETFEQIRVNAKYEVVWSNVRRFRDYALAKGTPFALTFCLMQHNWRELAEFCLFAESLGASVTVNQVRNPPALSVYTLPPDELRRLVDTMETQSATVLPQLKRNHAAWTDLLKSLQQVAQGKVSVPNLPRTDARPALAAPT